MNNSAVQQQDHNPTPGWAFLLGWWLCALGGWRLFQLFLNAMKRGVSMGSGASQWSDWAQRLYSLWPILIAGAFIGTGVLLLRTRNNWKKAVILISILAFVDTLVITIPSFLNFFGPHYYPLTCIPFLPYIFNTVSKLLFSILLILFACRFDRFKSPVITLMAFFLLTTSIVLLEEPTRRAFLLADSTIIMTYMTKIQMISFIAGSLISLTVPLLIITSGFALRSRPLWIRGIVVIFWIIGSFVVILSFWTGINIWNTRLDESGYLARALADVLQRVYNFLLPISLTIILASRYMDNFRAEENRLRGLNNCPHCGYNLTGNTSGQCPECGNPILDSQQPSEPTVPTPHE